MRLSNDQLKDPPLKTRAFFSGQRSPMPKAMRQFNVFLQTDLCEKSNLQNLHVQVLIVILILLIFYSFYVSFLSPLFILFYYIILHIPQYFSILWLISAVFRRRTNRLLRPLICEFLILFVVSTVLV